MPTTERPGGQEVMRIGPPPRRGRLVVVMIACVVLLLGGIAWWRHDRTPLAPSTSSSPALPPTSVRPTPTTPSILPGAPPQVSSTDLSWLQASGWELFARTQSPHGAMAGAGSVVRIQPGTGRVTQTAIPAVDSNGPMAFLAGPAAAYVHPLDGVPGYAVPDGKSARDSALRVPQGGILLPGPEPDQVWAQIHTPHDHSLTLITLGEHRPLVTISVPASAQGLPFSDGTGHLMVARAGGTYTLRRGTSRRVSTGTVIAVGPKAWVTSECKTRSSCRLTVIDPATGKRHRLPGEQPVPLASGGRTSPDGTVAALLVRGDAPRVVLVDLATGKATPTGARLPHHAPVAIHGQGAAVWSPDGKWLFVIDANRTIKAIDAHTGHARSLRLRLPNGDQTIQQIAVRP